MAAMKSRIRKVLTAAFFVILPLAGYAAADLAERVDAIISRPSQQKVQFSIHIIEADSGEMLYSHNARETLIPASNMKIIITASALKYLGPDYKYVTRVGLCESTLVVIGSGDPLLGEKTTDAAYGREKGWIFKDITTALESKGVTKVQDIIVDSTIFDEQYVHPSWPKKELNRSYACEVSGLNYNRNCIELSVKKSGSKVEIFIEPQTAFLKLTNQVEAITKGADAVGTYRTRKPNHIIVHGRCRDKEGPIEVAIEEPAVFFGFLLAEHLSRAGISGEGSIIEKPLDIGSEFVLLRQYYNSMADCLARCNKESLNLAAEALVKTIAVRNKPGSRNGSWREGTAMIACYLLDLGLDRSQFYLDDGSGLSRQNQLSAYAITTVLSDVYHGKNWAFYRDSLAVGGVDGTISKYFKEEKYKAKVLGKTGYLSGVRAFSGVCMTDEGDYIFSILANKANGLTRKAENDIAKAIIDEACD
jgi:D-alanyl-D-alanine carboxypeptidase/D-alanyl-D-alanine-endopeptidase (penicillin-binding protein 4)